MAPLPRSGLSLADHAVLALVAEQPRHGWAIVRELGPDGDVGRVWTLSRPLAYRSIDKLADRKLIRPTRTELGEGPRRTIYTATAAGRRAVEEWLDAPVEHLRDVRTALLLKLVIGAREGRDIRPLLRTQKRRLQPIIAGLAQAATAPNADLVDVWRHESAQAAARFLDGALAMRRDAVRRGNPRGGGGRTR
jgi:DNA-binding PadR family transcriptional regulator